MEQNPKVALDALLDTEKDCGELTVQPITAARYALLEITESPFVDFEKQFTISNIIPSLFICTAKNEDLKGYNTRNRERLEDRAMEWAQTIDLTKIGPAVEEITQRFKDIFKVAPGTGSADDKKKFTIQTTTAS